MKVLRIPDDVRSAMLKHARDCMPNEACGLLAGPAGDICIHMPIMNCDRTPVSYATDPRSLLAAFKHLREMGYELQAIWHSHPQGEAVPSQRDVQEWTYGSLPMVIMGLATDEIRAWTVQYGGLTRRAGGVSPLILMG